MDKEAKESPKEPRERSATLPAEDTNTAGLRKWAQRGKTASTRPSYKELVAERAEQQRKKEQTLDPSNWQRPKEDPVKECTLEFSSYAKEGTIRKVWEKKWFYLTQQELCYFKTKRDATPVGIISLQGAKVGVEEEKGKKHSFKLSNVRLVTQDMILNDHTFIIVCTAAEDMKDWMDKLQKVINSIAPSASDANKTSQVGGSEDSKSTEEKAESDKSSDIRTRSESWFEMTATSKLAYNSATMPHPLKDKDDNSISRKGSKAERPEKRINLQRTSLSLKRKKAPASPDPSTTTTTTTTSLMEFAATFKPQEPPKPLKPVLFYNPMISSSISLLFFIAENNVDIEKSTVHLSWILSSYTTEAHAESDAGNNNTNSRRRQSFTPKFLSLSPSKTVPVLDDTPLLTNSIAILRHLQSKHNIEQWYPNEDKTREKIDDIIDNWNLSPHVMEVMKLAVFEKLAKSSAVAPQQYKHNAALKEITKYLGRMETELKSHKYLVGDSITLADALWIGDIYLLSRVLKHDFSRYPNIRKWQQEIENCKSWTDVLNEFENTFSEYAPQLSNL